MDGSLAPGARASQGYRTERSLAARLSLSDASDSPHRIAGTVIAEPLLCGHAGRHAVMPYARSSKATTSVPHLRHTLRGKVAVVTGASSGVGRAVAREFAARGARVALLARGVDGLKRLAPEIEDGGGESLTLPLDVADALAVDAAADYVVALTDPSTSGRERSARSSGYASIPAWRSRRSASRQWLTSSGSAGRG
jgi:hypothetical protein